MNFKIFGYTFGANERPQGLSKFITPDFSEPTVDLQSSGFVSPSSTQFQLTTMIRGEHDAIAQYRDIAKQAEVDLAVEEIITEMVVLSHEKPAVELNLDFIRGMSDNTKLEIIDEFTNILGLLVIKNWNFSTFSFGVYFIVLNTSLILMIRRDLCLTVLVMK